MKRRRISSVRHRFSISAAYYPYGNRCWVTTRQPSWRIALLLEWAHSVATNQVPVHCPQAYLESSVETFDHAEQAYMNYVRTHPDHYILNVPRASSSYPILVHIAKCGTISTPKRTNYTTTEFFKIAFSGREAAIDHAKALAMQRGSGWTVCLICHAEPKR